MFTYSVLFNLATKAGLSEPQRQLSLMRPIQISRGTTKSNNNIHHDTCSMVLVVNFYLIFVIISFFFCFVVTIFDLVHDVEAIFHLP